MIDADVLMLLSPNYSALALDHKATIAMVALTLQTTATEQLPNLNASTSFCSGETGW